MLGHRSVSNVFLEGTGPVGSLPAVWGCMWHRWRELWPPKAAETGSILRGTNSGKTGAGVCFFVVLRGILYVTVCCVLQTYKQLRCTFGPSHVSATKTPAKRAVSNVGCRGVCVYDGRVFFLACKRCFLLFFLRRVLFFGSSCLFFKNERPQYA